jgi:hypothetical protein
MNLQFLVSSPHRLKHLKESAHLKISSQNMSEELVFHTQMCLYYSVSHGCLDCIANECVLYFIV